jgi:predicted site-specific integrase-resolvase
MAHASDGSELKPGDWATAVEAARYWHVSGETVRRWAREGMCETMTLPSGRYLVRLVTPTQQNVHRILAKRRK